MRGGDWSTEKGIHTWGRALLRERDGLISVNLPIGGELHTLIGASPEELLTTARRIAKVVAE